MRFSTKILDRIFVLLTEGVVTYVERKKTGIMTKYLSNFATEILDRIFILLPEGVVTHVESKKTGIMTKYQTVSRRRF